MRKSKTTHAPESKARDSSSGSGGTVGTTTIHRRRKPRSLVTRLARKIDNTSGKNGAQVRDGEHRTGRQEDDGAAGPPCDDRIANHEISEEDRYILWREQRPAAERRKCAMLRTRWRERLHQRRRDCRRETIGSRSIRSATRTSGKQKSGQVRDVEYQQGRLLAKNDILRHKKEKE
jgi:hypothetical protein